MTRRNAAPAFNWYRHLQHELAEGPSIPTAIEAQLMAEPRHVELRGKLLQHHLELREAMTPQGWSAYQRAEEIHNEHASLVEESAFNVGFVMGIAHARAGDDPSTTELAVRLLACIAEADLGTAARSRALLGALHALQETDQIE